MTQITVNDLMQIIGSEVRQLIESVHKLPITTKNHYGRYLPILTTLKGEGIPLELGKALMIKAGANKQGVNSASQILSQ
jgi:hypothetical protein